MNCVLHHLFLLEDLGQEIFRAKRRSKVVCHINRLVELSYLGFEYSLLFGDYFSSARGLRWIFEVCLAGFAACKDGKVLTGKQNDIGYLSVVKFKKWMRDLDQGTVKFKFSTRDRILTLLDLSREEKDRCAKLYSDLCKYAHVSNVSLRRDAPVPNLTLDMREFSKVYRMSVRTVDLSMYAILRSYAIIDDIDCFLDSYRSWFYPGRSYARLLSKRVSYYAKLCLWAEMRVHKRARRLPRSTVILKLRKLMMGHSECDYCKFSVSPLICPSGS